MNYNVLEPHLSDKTEIPQYCYDPRCLKTRQNTSIGDPTAITRTTRMPAFWGYPRHLMITHTIESYWIQSQKKISQSYEFGEFAKISMKLKWVLHTTHLPKLLDKMYKYEMDLTSIVEDTEQKRTDRRMDGQTGRWTRWNQYTLPQLHWEGGMTRWSL